jgi:hypothetical protein
MRTKVKIWKKRHHEGLGYCNYQLDLGFCVLIISPYHYGNGKTKWHGMASGVPLARDVHFTVHTPKNYSHPRKAADKLIFELKKQLRKVGLDLLPFIDSLEHRP